MRRGLISGVHVFWQTYKLHCKVLKILHLHLGKLQFISFLSSLANGILVVTKAGNNCTKLLLKLTTTMKSRKRLLVTEISVDAGVEAVLLDLDGV